MSQPSGHQLSLQRRCPWRGSRRRFLSTAGTLATALALPRSSRAQLSKLAKPIKIGLIADLHHDLIHDGPRRLAAFLKDMETERPDAILQLGDFTYPSDKNKPIWETFSKAHPRALHVLGNHEIDAGHTFDEVARIWNMPGRYYTATIGGLSLIVLDGNEKPPGHQRGYPAHVGPRQGEWLKDQLQQLDGPAIICCHQPLAGPASIDNANEIQQILAGAAEKVLLTVNGHTHIDHVVRAGKIVHLHINSAAYYWVGGAYRHKSYPDEIHAAHPALQNTCPYADPLFTMLTIDPDTRRVHVKPCESSWVGPSPAELGLDAHSQLIDGEQICPRIRDRGLLRPPL